MKNTLFGALLDAEGAESGLLAPMETFAAAAPGVRTTRDGIAIEQILRDRPDVFRAFYDAFHGGGNDPHSSAWIERVGGTTVEDYANYWYEQHGRWEGYGQGGSGGASAPLEDGAFVLPPGILETGRTTVEGYLLSQILTERPDVFRAFFTEFYGPNNDRNSTAWVDRVGGTTVEDYANYWWETYGRWSGWTPGQGGKDGGGGGALPDPEDEASEDPLPSEEPLVFEFTEDGIVMRPARPDDIVEGGIVVGRRPSDEAGGQATPGDGPADATGGFDLWAGMARPLIYEPRSDGGFDLRPAAANEFVEDGVVVGYAFFTPDPFG
ncbi:hypothetical protein [Phenylobacterium sp. SCN 70-31]|uniref:hypothetical protein n=1 Tax=Phenylobacterium sp. SCN 70-31 TaxID=1660129 RepID=UPI00086CD3E3|nr:hypothetical protein [Phenylobacterium sp. SCN 70-31]ODT84397.1 MAG: hypothetical protein ABS78_22780 [Phenylobacterium sp. SCN 70-31]